MTRNLLFLLVLIIFVDISSSQAEEKKVRMPGDMQFSEYTGADASEWETSSGALADRSYDIPVYRGWPSKPYVVIGEIHHKDPRKEWRDGEIQDAIKGAKRVNGSAIIIRLTSERGVGAVTGTLGNNTARGASGIQWGTTALVIRWQTDAEIKARSARDERLFKQLLAAKPDLAINNDTAALVIKYLLQSGPGDVSPDFFERYQAIMLRLSPVSMGGFSGEWVFKATVKEKGLVSEKEEQYLGIASVRSDGESLAIVSTEGKTEMSFSGQNEKGRLTGQVAVAGFSAKGEGVALEDKLSVSWQSLTPDGTAQGVVVMQRNRVKKGVESKATNQKL